MTIDTDRSRLCSNIAAVIIGVSILGPTALGAEQKVAFWPLDDGKGQTVRDGVGSFNGTFRTQDSDMPLKWGQRDGKPVLLFPGSTGAPGGHVEIGKGGSILSGPMFALGLDVHLESAPGGCFLLACKHGSTKTGGFTLHYWAGARKLTFCFADGREKFSFAAKLKKRIPLKKWVSIAVTYDGETLSMSLAGETVGSFKDPGRILAKSRYALKIGAYYNKLGGRSFHGSIRNAWLGRPASVENRIMLYAAKPAGAAPAIDGGLSDACWRRAAFAGGFVKLGTTEPARVATEFAVAYDSEKVYMAVRCSQPAVHKMRAEARERDGEIFGDDSIEIFIDPDSSGDHYFHLGLNAANAQFDTVVTNLGNTKRRDFNMKWDSAVRKGARAWTAEMAFPYMELLVKQDNPGYWHLNICRNDSVAEKHDRYSSWGRGKKGERITGFHDSRLLGSLTGLPKPQYTKNRWGAVKRGRRIWELDREPIREPIALYTIHEPLMVANNMVVPNVLANKAPGDVVNRLKAQFILDVPEGIELLRVGSMYVPFGGGSGQLEVEQTGQVTHGGKLYTRCVATPVKMHRNQMLFGPIYLRSSAPDGQQTDIYCGAKWNGGEQKPKRAQVVVKTFPTPGMPKKLVSSLAWMFAYAYLGWPDMLATYQKLGFNTIGTHYAYDRNVPVETRAEFFDKARSQGLKIMCLGSPFSSIRSRQDGNSLKPDGTPFDGQDGCPAYRGPLYQKDIQKIEEAVRWIKPDIVNLDIECYSEGSFAGRTGTCKRCNDYIRRTGKRDAAEAVSDLGTEMMLDVRKAMTRAMESQGLPVPALGTYHTKPGGFTYQDTFNFDKMLRAGAVDYCHPVFYRSAKAKDSGKEMRQYRRLLGAGSMLPWMTTGYMGSGNVVEYPSEWVYDYVLEAYSSGCRGILWFAFAKFEAADYYYHAKAMESVVPVSELIYDAELIDGIVCDNPGFSVTGLHREGELVLLVSNYDKPEPANVSVKLPAAVTGALVDLTRAKRVASVDGRAVTVRFRPGVAGAHTALYYIGKGLRETR